MAYLAAPELPAGNAPTSAAEFGSGLAVAVYLSESFVPGVTWASGVAPTFGFGEPWEHVQSGGGNGPTIVYVAGTVAYPG